MDYAFMTIVALAIGTAWVLWYMVEKISEG